MLDQAEVIGLDEASIARLAADLNDDADDGEGVFELNVPAVTAFLQVGSQWRTAIEPTQFGFRTRWVGLDYQAVLAALGALGVAVTPELFGDLQVMENAAVHALNGWSE